MNLNLEEALISEPMPRDLLKNRVILIVGASGGIGSACAKAFAHHGAELILLGKSVKKLEQLYDTIIEQGGPQPALYPLNLANAQPKDFQTLAERVEETFGRLDGLLNTAALFPALTPIEHLSAGQWHEIMQVNTNGPFMLTQACLPLLKRSTDASIVFTSDQCASHAKAYWGAYACSKAATDRFMEILADELEINTLIRVNSINPGPVRTPMRAKLFPAERAEQHRTPEALIPYYLHLMGPNSHGLTGKIMTIPHQEKPSGETTQ